MAKTDKELTIEVVNTYIASWNARESAKPLQPDHLTDLIQNVYSAIHQLPDESRKIEE